MDRDHDSARSLATTLDQEETQHTQQSGLALVPAFSLTSIADLLSQDVLDDEAIDRVAGKQRERPAADGAIPKITCTSCRGVIGPGYHETEVFYEISSRSWVCGWHYRRDLETVDNYIKLATSEEVDRLTAPQLNRLLLQRTKEIA